MARHALSREDKEARRDHILEEALVLFLQDTRRLPTVAAIADRARLAKGTVYLYFETKELIFAALLTREWRQLLSEVRLAFVESPSDLHSKVDVFIDRFVAFLAHHPYFLELDALGYALLESNLSAEQLAAFKEGFSRTIDETAVTLEAQLMVGNGRGRELLTRTYAMTRGLWQVAIYPDDHSAVEGPNGTASSRKAFDVDLTAALHEYWRGAYSIGPAKAP